MQLTSHFTLAELTASQIADRNGIDNNPNDKVISALTVLCHGLEMIRTLVGFPISVSSGYRCEGLERMVCDGAYKSWCKNHGKSVDMQSWKEYFATKQHPLGSSADITCPEYGDPKSLMKVILAAKLPYDQLILEFYQSATWSTPSRGWVHVSFVRNDPRKQALVIDGQGTRVFA
jgi:hypothetical protein